MADGDYTNLEHGIDIREHPWLEEDQRSTSQTIGDAFRSGVQHIPLFPWLALDDAQHAGQAASPQGRALAPRVDPDEIARQTAAADVQIDIPQEGLSQPALDVLIQRKREDKVFESRAARAASGFVPGVGSFVAGAASQLLDPISDVALLVPGIGEERIAAILARTTSGLGRAGVRFGAEYARATAGLVAVEPLQSHLHQQLQDDYDFRDSLESIALGGFVFGGLRVAGGAVLDRFGAAAKRGIPEPAPVGAELRGQGAQARAEVRAEVAGLPSARTLQTPETLRPVSLITEPLAGKSAADIIKRADEYRDLAAGLARKPGFEHTAAEKVFLRGIERYGLNELVRSDAGFEHLTPELAKLIEIASKPAFARTLDEKVFLEALQKGHEGEFINDRIGKSAERIEQIDKDLTGAHSGDLGRITERNHLLDDLHDAARRLKEIGYEPLRVDHILARVSETTRQQALRTMIAQAIGDKDIRIMELLRLDPRVAGLPRATLSEVAAAGREVRSPAGTNGGREGVEAAAHADRLIANGSAKEGADVATEIHAENQVFRAETEQMEKALGQEGRLAQELEVDDFNQRADTLAKAAQFALGCDLG